MQCKTTFTLFLLLTGMVAYGQYPSKKKTSSLYINKENLTIKAEALNEQQNFTADKNATYHWCLSNNIMETQGGYSGKLLHGKYVSYFFSNNLREQGNFKKGLKEGDWISWYENGKIQEITHWQKGKKSSGYKLYNERGQLVVEAHFKDNQLNGKMTSYEEGKIVSIKKYRNGKEVIKKEKKEKSRKLKIFGRKKAKPQLSTIDIEKEKKEKTIKPRKIKKTIKKLFKKKEKEDKPKEKVPVQKPLVKQT